MKLFEIFIENNLDYEDYDCQNKFIVTNSQQEAVIRAESWMRDIYCSGFAEPSFSVTEIKEVDGFIVSVDRKDYKQMAKTFIGETMVDFFCNGFFGSRAFDMAGAEITKVYDSDDDDAIVIEVRKLGGKYDYGYFKDFWRDWQTVYEHLEEWTSEDSNK